MAIDFSTGCAYVSHASGVLGVCVMVTLSMVVQRLSGRDPAEETQLGRDPAVPYETGTRLIGVLIPISVSALSR